MDPDVTSFFSGLSATLENIQLAGEKMNLLLSTRFTVFDYIQPDENGLSDIIADLLKPEGAHGQRSKFLRLFLKRLGLDGDLEASDEVVTGHVKIERESRTERIEKSMRRMDIHVRLEEFGQLKGFGIGIENKPWAADLEDQVESYVSHLEKTYSGRFHMVYLSRQGGPPTNMSDERVRRLSNQRQFSTWSYTGQFLQWIQECRRHCESDRVRWFLRDFESYVSRNLFRYPEVAEGDRDDR